MQQPNIIAIAPWARRRRNTADGGRAAKATLFAITVILLTCVYRETFDTITILFIANYHLTTAEPVVFATFFAMIICVFERAPRLSLASIMVFVIFSLLIFNLLRGILLSPMDAMIWMRSNGSLAPILMIGLVVPRNYEAYRQINLCIYTTSIALSVVALVKVVTGYSDFLGSDLGDLDDSRRALSASGAIVLSMACILSTGDWIRQPSLFRRRTNLFILLTGLAGLILCRQGTAIVCALTGIFIVVVLERGRTGAVRMLGIVSASLIAIVYLVVSDGSIGASSTLGANVDRRSLTLQSREAIWQGFDHYFSEQSFVSRVIGAPASSPPEFYIERRGQLEQWGNSLHSMYFTMLSLTGYLGLAAYVLLLGYCWFDGLRRCFSRKAAAALVTPATALGLTSAAVLYGYTYELRREELLLVFLTLLSLPTLLPRRQMGQRSFDHRGEISTSSNM